MAKIKSYSDLQQSKKLAEILPPESADMCYILHATSDNLDWRFDDDVPPMVLGETPINKLTVKALPCWSLEALLYIMPKHIKDYNVLRLDISDNDFAIWYDKVGYGVNNELPNITKEYAVDACYEMILKLHELKML